MTCEMIRDSDGNHCFFCTSEDLTEVRCACGNLSTHQCDFPMSGRREGQTCDRYICPHCATEVEGVRQMVGGFYETFDLCPVHARVMGLWLPTWLPNTTGR